MALARSHSWSILTLLALSFLLINTGSCFKRKLFYNVLNESQSTWSPAGATWYGSANGAGSNEGACGYGDAVEQAPFSSFTTAGGPSLFKSGKECGACYQVKCTASVNPACSEQLVTVVITDECPGCASESVHFDLSGTAFGAMALPGQAHQLRNAGVLEIQYQRAKCSYPDKKITFQVDTGSNPYYFAALIKYVDGDGVLGSVELKQAGDSDSWLPLQQSWGAVWKLDAGFALQAPFSIRLTGLDFGNTIVANNVIPDGWKPGETYTSDVTFAT
ncbi:putative expansin-B2 [Ziziphus jujuba]|uniref:Expansin-B2 n=1 Tax=Ziziphus jujuba TaxID=326968 RepID=A0ABM3IS38_ZIZJJ|nr:putative expansin-B2 [Ziziphus jujuba]